MDGSNFILKTKKGKNTLLDKAYRKLINKVLETTDEDKIERWETYNLIIKDLVSIDCGKHFEEVKYRLTDGENPNSVLLNIIDRCGHEVSGLVFILKRRVEEYLEEDLMKRFTE